MGRRFEICLLDGAAHNGITSKTCIKCKRIRARQWRKTPEGIENTRRHNAHYKTKPGYVAKMEVFKAVRSGLLPRVKTLSCIDCAKPAQGYDHRDYSKPLNVVPVCFSCNRRRGPAVTP